MSDYREFSSIEEYIEKEMAPRVENPFDESITFKLKKMADDVRRKRFKVRGCPINDFKPCHLDDCALFENEIPGLPWWGSCQLGRRKCS